MTQNSTQSIAILIFAQSSIDDAKQKNISGGEKLFDALNEHFLEKVKKSGLPHVIVNGGNQKGNSFGQRFSNAIESVFNQGFENIITIGNDSPRLTTSILKNAAKHLKEKNAVIGPSFDGGFYLLGMHHSNFDKSKFEKLSWQTPKIIREVQKVLDAKEIKYSLLSTLFDIDCLYDLKIFINQSNDCSKRLHKIAKDIFDTTVSKYLFVDIIDEQLTSFEEQNKDSTYL